MSDDPGTHLLDANHPGDYGTVLCYPSKTYVPIFEFRPHHVRVRDIAHSLSSMARFNGHSAPVISVGEHCLDVADLLPDELKLEGLFHDAAEAYLGDVVRPLKYHPRFSAYLEIEEEIESQIAPALGLVWPFPPEIKAADNKRLQFEIDYLRFAAFDPDGNLLFPAWSAPSTDARLIEMAFLAAARPLLIARIGIDATEEIW